MRKSSNAILIGLLLLFVMASCTVEKRLYNKGYYVDWHIGNEKQKAHKQRADKIERQTEAKVAMIEPSVQMADLSLPESEELTSVLVQRNSKISARTFSRTERNQPLLRESDQVFFASRRYQLENESDASGSASDGNIKTHGLAIAGMIIGIVGWFMPLTLGLIFCVVALVFGFVSLGTVNRYPDKYKGRGLAITSIVLGLVGISILLLFIM